MRIAGAKRWPGSAFVAGPDRRVQDLLDGELMAHGVVILLLEFLKLLHHIGGHLLGTRFAVDVVHLVGVGGHNYQIL